MMLQPRTYNRRIRTRLNTNSAVFNLLKQGERVSIVLPYPESDEMYLCYSRGVLVDRIGDRQYNALVECRGVDLEDTAEQNGKLVFTYRYRAPVTAQDE